MECTYSSPAELLIIDLIGLCGTLQVCTQDVDDVPLLLFAEELGFAGCVWQEEEGSDGDHNCQGTFHEEDPRPSVVSAESDLG